MYSNFNNQHYDVVYQNNKYAKLETRKVAVNKLKDGKQGKNKQCYVYINGNAMTEANYKVAYLLGKIG